MGLLKETMQAIIHIDQNLNRLCNSLVADISNISKEDITKYKREFSGRVINNKAFDYPANLTLGGRFTALREYMHLKQHEVAQILRVTPSYVSRFESDKAIPSGTLIRFASQYFNISEQWLATGHLPQTTEEPAKPLATCKVTPLSGYEHEADMPSEIMIDFGRDRGLLPIQRSPLVDKNISQENI